ncbi:MAG TPA: tetratricopeptide repeat protein [Phycisphaerae bacterium]|nr:tetratricopeptide repeat protein [Phycisphaerae bacterium]
MARHARMQPTLPAKLQRLLVALALPVLVGCAELPPAAKQQKTDAENAYRSNNYQAAMGTLNDFLKNYPDHPESAEAYYLRALCEEKQSNKMKAAEDAQHCIRLSRDAVLTAKAHAMTATLLYEAGKSAAAIPHFASALKGLPDGPPADLVRYNYGVCLQREGQWKQARMEFAAVPRLFPSSPLAENAKRMNEWPNDFFTIQCGAFRDKPEANKLVDKLKKAGLSPRIEARSRSGETLQMVYVGQYPRYSQAQSALTAVQRQVRDASIAP